MCGRRLAVEDVVGTVAHGEEEETFFLEENPYLTKTHIKVCLVYAADHGYYKKRLIVNVKPGATTEK